MPIQFDEHGNPSPYELVNLTMDRFQQLFTSIPDLDRRLWLLTQLNKYIRDFNDDISPDNWVQLFGGSYITNKSYPNDIDLVNFIDSYSAEKAGQQIFAFITNNKINADSKVTYSVDGYLVPIFDTNDPRYNITVAYYKYWSTWLGHDRLDRPKAVVKVIQK
jgi:hypothetical protein